MAVDSLRMSSPLGINVATTAPPVSNTSESNTVEKPASDSPLNKTDSTIAQANAEDSQEKSFEDSEAKNALLQKAIESSNKTLQNHGRQLKFAIHNKTNRVMVKVIDSDTDEVIREIPPEKVLDSYAKMLEMAGLLFDEQS